MRGEGSKLRPGSIVSLRGPKPEAISVGKNPGLLRRFSPRNDKVGLDCELSVWRRIGRTAIRDPNNETHLT